MSHHVLHVDREHRVPILVDLASAPGRIIVFTRTKHGAKALARQLNKSGVPTVELPRKPRPGCAHPQHGGLPLRQGRGARRHRHRRARHPRRRRGPRRPRRPAGRAQGVPAPLRSYGARRQRRHRRHPDDQRAGPRRPRPHPCRRHQADDHPDQRLDATPCWSSSPPASGPCPARSRPRLLRRRPRRALVAAAEGATVVVAVAGVGSRWLGGQKPSGQKSSGQKSSGQKSSGGNRSRRPASRGAVPRSGGGTHSAASFSGRR